MTTAAGLWARGRWIDPVGDAGFSWSLAYRLAHGERLYRDVYVAYGPLSPYLAAIWARLFGASSFSILLLNWIPAILAALLLIRCTRELFSPIERVVLAGMILAGSLFVPGPGRLVFPYYAGVVHAFCFSAGALLLVHPGRRLRHAALWAGVLAGLAFACKQEIGVAALAAVIAGALAAPEGERRVRRAATALFGFSVVAVAAAAFALWCAPLDWLRDRDHLWPLNPRTPTTFDTLFRSVSGFSDPNWFAGLRATAWKLSGGVALLAALGGLLARERSWTAWRRLAWLAGGLGVWWAIERFSPTSTVAPVRLSVLASFLVCVLAFFSPELPGRAFVIALGVFSGLAGLRAAVSPFTTGPYDAPAHFAAAAVWLVLLLVLAPTLLWPQPHARAALLTRGAVAVVLGVTFWWDALGGAAALGFPWKQEVSTPQGPVYLEPGQARLLGEVGRNVAAGDRVLVLPEINAVDALFGARSVSPLLHHFPGWLDPRAESELIRRLEAHPPAVVVLFTRPTPELEMAPFGEGFGVAIWEWCLRHYRVVFSSPRGKILRLRDERGSPGAAVAPGATR